ncbi:DUF4177 domain-containing protein [Pseudonocardia cypriaca]|uniref:DUF4177 domain-containing protein n=1 Tax=Pseudonocardia cypriaca TaxID=882449 RepID=UPI001152EC62|nr:DUF4177 domain-containing protein [Pseudonocardia cypriaca]
MQRFEYQVLQTRQSMIGGKFSPDKLEDVLNDEARSGAASRLAGETPIRDSSSLAAASSTWCAVAVLVSSAVMRAHRPSDGRDPQVGLCLLIGYVVRRSSRREARVGTPAAPGASGRRRAGPVADAQAAPVAHPGRQGQVTVAGGAKRPCRVGTDDQGAGRLGYVEAQGR